MSRPLRWQEASLEMNGWIASGYHNLDHINSIWYKFIEQMDLSSMCHEYVVVA